MATDGDIVWEREWLSDGFVSHRFGRAADLLVAEWAGVGRLFASRDGSMHRFEVDEGADLDTAQRIERFIAPSLVRHLRGEITLHASAVVLDEAGIAFLGVSGAGKSTMAWALCRRAGALLVADDMLHVSHVDGAPLVVPTERSNRLAPSPEAPRRKEDVAPRRLASAPVALAAMVELVLDERSIHPSLAPIEGAARFDAVSHAFMRFTADDPATNLRDFVTIGRLASDVPVFSLRRRWSPEAIERSVDVVCEARRSWDRR